MPDQMKLADSAADDFLVKVMANWDVLVALLGKRSLRVSEIKVRIPSAQSLNNFLPIVSLKRQKLTKKRLGRAHL